MASVNIAILVGNIGRDPELKLTQSNVAVCTLSVATGERWKDKQTGEWKEDTEWHKVVCWRWLADRVAERVAKGDKVYVEGKIKTRKWEKDGIARYSTEIVASRVERLNKREAGSDEQAPQPEEDDDLPF